MKRRIKIRQLARSRHFVICTVLGLIMLIGFGYYFVNTSHVSHASAPTPPSDTCALSQIAFCDTFDTSVGGGRAGGLDPAKWSFSRITSQVLPFQFQVNNYPLAIADVCGTQKTVQPPNDVLLCGGKFGQPNHLVEAIDDGGIYNSSIRLAGGGTHPDYFEGNVVVNSNRAVQPFDFTGRTGNIVFDVTADLDGTGLDRPHGWWPEIWLTDQPVQAPHINAAHVNNDPRNAIGFIMNDCAGAGTNQHVGGLNEMITINNYVATTMNPAQTCFVTKENVSNHFQIKISQNNVELWGSDVGGANFRILASATVSLNFSRGYLSFEHVHYNAAKYGYDNTSTFAWHAIGFDGPIIPADREYQMPDALHIITPAEAQQAGALAGSVNLGYQLGSCSALGCPCPPTSFGNGQCTASAYSTPTFNLANVDLSNVSQANLTYNIWYDLGAHQVNANVNSTNFSITDPNTSCINEACFSSLWRTIVQPIPVSALHNGTNTVSLSALAPGGQNPSVANIDLQLIHNP